MADDDPQVPDPELKAKLQSLHELHAQVPDDLRRPRSNSDEARLRRAWFNRGKETLAQAEERHSKVVQHADRLNADFARVHREVDELRELQAATSNAELREDPDPEGDRLDAHIESLRTERARLAEVADAARQARSDELADLRGRLASLQEREKDLQETVEDTDHRRAGLADRTAAERAEISELRARSERLVPYAQQLRERVAQLPE